MRARLGILTTQIRPSSSTFPLHREVMHPPVHLWLTGKMDSPNQSVKRWLIRNELGAFWNHTCVMKSQAHSHWEQISHAAWLIKKQTMLHTYTFLCFLIKNTHKKNVCGSSEQTCGGKTKTLTVSSRYCLVTSANPSGDVSAYWCTWPDVSPSYDRPCHSREHLPWRSCLWVSAACLCCHEGTWVNVTLLCQV